MATLFFDGDKRRVYEVPDAPSSFTTDGNGYRIYTPDNIPGAETDVRLTVFDVWSRWVDYHNSNKWAYLALAISGGDFRYQDSQGNDVFALPDLRWINDWQFVPADYPHNITIVGNIYPNVSDGSDFDVSRLTAQGVSPRIEFTDRGERSIIAGAGGTDWTDAEKAQMRKALGITGTTATPEATGDLQVTKVLASDAADG